MTQPVQATLGTTSAAESVGLAASVSPASPTAKLPSLAVVLRTLGLLFAEGAAFGLFLWGTWHATELLPFALENRLSLQERQALLGSMFGTGALVLLAAGLYAALRARVALARLDHVSRRCAPLMAIGLVPFLFRWQLWQSRELTFGVLVSVLGIGLRFAFQASLRADPLFEPSEFVEWLTRARTRWLDRLRTWLPLTLVVLGVMGYATFFSYHTVANHRNLLSSSFDLGLEDNLLWNLVHAGPFLKTSPAFGPTGSHFGYHATFFAYVIGVFYAFYQHAETLLVLQSVMIAAAAIPLYLYAQRRIGAWMACVLALAYLLYAPVHGSNLYDFHYLPLGVFFLWLTLYLLDTRRDVWAALAILLTLSVREDVAACLVIIGAYLIFAGNRPRAGLVVAVVAGVYFIALKMVIMPQALKGSSSFIHQWQGLLPAGESGYGGVIKTVVANPIFTLTSLLEEQKFLYLVQLGAPLCFLPWRRSIGLLCSIPGFFFTLLATGYLPLIQISFQYTAHWTSFLFLAVVANLEWTGRAAHPGDAEGPNRQRSWLLAITVLTLATSYQYGALLQQNTARGGFGTYRFGTTEADRQRYADLKTLIGKVPPRAKIVGSENVVPHLSNRPDAYTLRVGIFDAEYLLFQVPAGGEEATNARTALSDEFGVVEVRAPFVLARRGYSQDLNAATLRKLR